MLWHRILQLTINPYIIRHLIWETVCLKERTVWRFFWQMDGMQDMHRGFPD